MLFGSSGNRSEPRAAFTTSFSHRGYKTTRQRVNRCKQLSTAREPWELKIAGCLCTALNAPERGVSDVPSIERLGPPVYIKTTGAANYGNTVERLELISAIECLTKTAFRRWRNRGDQPGHLAIVG